MTEDMLEEQAEILTQLGTSEEGARVRAQMQCASLLSDMEAFKVGRLFFTSVAHNSMVTNKLLTLEFPIKLDVRRVGFCGGEGTCRTRRNIYQGKDKNQEQT